MKAKYASLKVTGRLATVNQNVGTMVHPIEVKLGCAEGGLMENKMPPLDPRAVEFIEGWPLYDNAVVGHLLYFIYARLRRDC